MSTIIIFNIASLLAIIIPAFIVYKIQKSNLNKGLRITLTIIGGIMIIASVCSLGFMFFVDAMIALGIIGLVPN